MFQKSLQAVTKKVGKKYRTPNLKVETIEDIYTLFVLNSNIPAEDFWNQDIRFLEIVYLNKIAFDNYIHNPKER